MKQCQDNDSTQFSLLPEIQTYHEALRHSSHWTRIQVKHLEVAPPDKNAALFSDRFHFQPEISEDAITDTAANLGLAVKVDGLYYPLRDTAYRSLLDRAKISGTALPKLSREKLASVLNSCLILHRADALLLNRDEKVSAPIPVTRRITPSWKSIGFWSPFGARWMSASPTACLLEDRATIPSPVLPVYSENGRENAGGKTAGLAGEHGPCPDSALAGLRFCKEGELVMPAPILLCNTSGMSEAQWLACRDHGPGGDIEYTVGGSDVAAIFGLSPWVPSLSCGCRRRAA